MPSVAPTATVMDAPTDTPSENDLEVNTDGMGLCGLVKSTNIGRISTDWSCSGTVPDSPVCDWTGVTCNMHGRVSEISW